ncbi:MAG: protein BatD [Chloroflexi bacterium]|nr:protein BatD [Chloroflexota bacterium]
MSAHGGRAPTESHARFWPVIIALTVAILVIIFFWRRRSR